MADRTNPLVRVLARMRGALIAAGMFSFFMNMLLLTVPLHMLHVYDHVLTSRSVPTLVLLTGLAVALLAALGLLDLFRSRILGRVGAMLDRELGDPVFASCVVDRVHKRSEPSAQSIRDLDTVRSFVSGSALPTLFDAPWTPLFIAVIFLLHPWLGWIAVFGALVLLLTALANETLTKRTARETTNHAIVATGFAESALRSAEAIEAMGMRSGIRGRWRAYHNRAVRGQARIADVSTHFTAFAKFWRLFLQVGMLSAAAWLAIDNTITAGTMIAASIVMARALAPVEGAIASWRSYGLARGAYTRLSQALSKHVERPERMRLPDPCGEVAVSSIFVAPPGRVKPILKGVSFALSRGEALGVIGPSAAGKSTLARALVGVWPILSGDIRFDGAALGDFDPAHLGRRIGYLPQDVELFDGTVADNIARFDEAASPDLIIAAARLAGVHDMILRLPQAYDTRIGAEGEALSGGQRQRIALARAFYGVPAIVVLDEPNSSLDAEGEEALKAGILAIKAHGAAVIVIAHRPTLTMAVDTLLVLRDGMVEMCGPRSEVLAKVTRPVSPLRDAGVGVVNVGAR